MVSCLGLRGARMDIRLRRKMRRHRYLLRFLGCSWSLIGGLLLYNFIPVVLDPNATIVYDRVPTTVIGIKISWVLCVSAFFVAGIGFFLAPSRFLDRWFIWNQSLWRAIAF